MKARKTPHDVKGFKEKCKNFEQCPLCYGCRAYNSRFIKCIKCKSENSKANICNTSLHRADLISQMITREKVIVRNI